MLGWGNIIRNMGKKTRKLLMNRLRTIESDCPWLPLGPCDPCNDKPSPKDKAEFAEKVLKLIQGLPAAPAPPARAYYPSLDRFDGY